MGVVMIRCPRTGAMCRRAWRWTRAHRDALPVVPSKMHCSGLRRGTRLVEGHAQFVGIGRNSSVNRSRTAPERRASSPARSAPRRGRDGCGSVSPERQQRQLASPMPGAILREGAPVESSHRPETVNRERRPTGRAAQPSARCRSRARPRLPGDCLSLVLFL